MKQCANATPQPNSETFYAAYHRTPSRLAGERVKAVIVAMLGVGAVIVAVLAAAETHTPAVILAGLAVAIVCAIYTWSVLNDVQNVRRALWDLELADGEDHDGDNHIGPPTTIVGHLLPIGRGQQQQAVTLPDIDPPPVRQALAGFPAHPPISPNDVVYILTHAAAGDGLTFRPWEGRRLPSGSVIQRDTWAGILDGLIEWQFADATTTAAGKRKVNLRTDMGVEPMIQQIRNSVDI